MRKLSRADKALKSVQVNAYKAAKAKGFSWRESNAFGYFVAGKYTGNAVPKERLIEIVKIVQGAKLQAVAAKLPVKPSAKPKPVVAVTPAKPEKTEIERRLDKLEELVLAVLASSPKVKKPKSKPKASLSLVTAITDIDNFADCPF